MLLKYKIKKALTECAQKNQGSQSEHCDSTTLHNCLPTNVIKSEVMLFFQS